MTNTVKSNHQFPEVEMHVEIEDGAATEADTGALNTALSAIAADSRRDSLGYLRQLVVPKGGE